MVVDAIAAGRRAAIAIDKFLRGDTSRVEMYDLKPSVIEEVISEEDEEETWEPQLRPEMSRLPFEERKRSFKETELGFSEEIAKQEAQRCLRCDLER
jgi:NADH-quinone oxidoreductase subunit F